MLLRERAGPLADPQRKLLEEAERACARLSGLITELSDLANLDAGTATINRIDLEIFQLAAEAAGEVRPAGEQRVTITVGGDPADGLVVGDPVRLRRALGAIVSALLRETVHSHTLIVERRRIMYHNGEAALILVGDGASVSEIQTVRLDELSAFDEWRGGCGLELPIARRVIEAHNGQIRSLPGHEGRPGVAILLPLKAAVARV